MQIVYKKVEDLIPYENNPRKNEEAIKFVANSIKEFGFKNPIIIDANNVILAGHTRLEGAKTLGLKQVPTITVTDLTKEQADAFRIADNKTHEKSDWDFGVLSEELEGLLDFDFTDFGFSEFEISALIEGTSPFEFDQSLIDEYASASDDFLAGKRVIITYTNDQEHLLKNILGLPPQEDMRVTYSFEQLLEGRG